MRITFEEKPTKVTFGEIGPHKRDENVRKLLKAEESQAVMEEKIMPPPIAKPNTSYLADLSKYPQ